jgi:cathepsin A (carboxypeptidase C)
MIKSLKDFDNKYTFPCMYSGFVEVEKESNSNLFYWFFRHERMEDSAPLVFWINGGPGSSSMLGNFLENGPLKIVKDDKNNTKVHSINDQAWTAVANMVYVDQPIGVGYSYGHRKITEGKQIGEYIIKFFIGFYENYPDMKSKKLYISGESYAGKYLPQIASSIIDYNQEKADDDKIPLTGVLIGNGFVDPITQRMSMRQLSVGAGHLQFDSLPELDIVEKRCYDANANKDSDAPSICGYVATFLRTINGGMNSYDIRYPESNSTIPKGYMEEYLNQPEVVSQVHADSSDKTPKFISSNSTVHENFDGDGMIRYIDEHQKILDHGLTLLIFAGNFDNRDGPYGIQQWMKKLKWSEMTEFHSSPTKIYRYVSYDNKEIRLGGNFKQHKNLNFLVVYAAGHMVPATQLALSRNMLEDIITHGELQCRDELGSGDCIAGKFLPQLMDLCNNNGKIVKNK